MKKISKYQLFSIIISVIVGLSFFVCFLTMPAPKMALTNPKPTQEDYNTLKEYALKVVVGEESKIPEEISVNKKITENTLIVTVETERMYGIKATFELIDSKETYTNAIIEYKAIIDCDSVTYLEYNNLHSKTIYILSNGTASSFMGFAVYMLIYMAPVGHKQKMKKIKEYERNTKVLEELENNK